MGYIYKITNKTDGNVYIGQTANPYEIRWREHKNCAFNPNRISYDYPLYKAIREYGLHNFSFEVLEVCPVELLDEKERFYIDKFDSYKNGYNQTLGGHSDRFFQLNDEDVIKKYSEMGNINAVADFFGCCHQSIAAILKRNNIRIKSSTQHAKERGNKIFQYNEAGILLNTFNNRTEIGQWLLDNNLSQNDTPTMAGDNFRCKFRKSSEFFLYGYFWKLEKPYDLSAYAEHKRVYPKDQCPLCGKEKLATSHTCIACSQKENQKKKITERETILNLSREQLKREIRTTSFLQLAKKYGVSDNAIRKWCKAYELPFRVCDIKKYSEQEWLYI